VTVPSVLQDATQIFQIESKASPEAIEEAIADPELTNPNGYTGLAHDDLGPGGANRVVANEEFNAAAVAAVAAGFPYPDLVVDDEAIEADPPCRLASTIQAFGCDGSLPPRGIPPLLAGQTQFHIASSPR
jgi:hypothetical protein